ncbi:hypothetical protein LY048_004091 [Salmonella enterica]|nr:hypothetical protein [Salmonella enterica]
MTNMDDWSAATAERRKKLAKLAVMQLGVVEELLSEIIDSYPEEKVSSAHPKSGAMQTMKRLQGLIKEMERFK